MEMLNRHHPDMILLDILLDGTLTGIDFARVLLERKLPFIYLTANSNRKIFLAAKATKPYGFLVKPFRQRDVLATLEVAIELHTALHKRSPILSDPTQSIGSPTGSDKFQIVSKSRTMQNVLEHIQLVGPSESSVLILGETGTGKELVAKAIHESSRRKNMPMIVVNCGALPPSIVESELFGHEKGSFTGALEKRLGSFEMANGGTIFLDEVGELAPDLQVKFL
jgi:DNA-binding NtrC family response regulator